MKHIRSKGKSTSNNYMKNVRTSNDYHFIHTDDADFQPAEAHPSTMRNCTTPSDVN